MTLSEIVYYICYGANVRSLSVAFRNYGDGLPLELYTGFSVPGWVLKSFCSLDFLQ